MTIINVNILLNQILQADKVADTLVSQQTGHFCNQTNDTSSEKAPSHRFMDFTERGNVSLVGCKYMDKSCIYRKYIIIPSMPQNYASISFK